MRTLLMVTLLGWGGPIAHESSPVLDLTLELGSTRHPTVVQLMAEASGADGDYPTLDVWAHLVSWEFLAVGDGDDTGIVDLGTVGSSRDTYENPDALSVQLVPISRVERTGSEVWKLNGDPSVDGSDYSIVAGSVCVSGSTDTCQAELALEIRNLTGGPLRISLEVNSNVRVYYAHCTCSPSLTTSLDVLGVTPPEALLP